MTTQDKASFDFSTLNEAIATAIKTSRAIADRAQAAAMVTGESIVPVVYELVSQGTETIGKAVTPIAEHPFVRFATKVPGVNVLMAALGQVDVDKVQRDVEALRQQHPTETPEQLAQRVMADTAWKAAGVGLATNFIPPLALMLFAVDFGAISALQAEMIYRIATIYGFSPTEPTRRGEVLAIWGLSTGSSGVIKSGLSIVEIIPLVGTVVGTAGDAGLLYSMGYLACRFYEEKKRSS